MGRYWVQRRGRWYEMVMVEADSPGRALKLARKIPEAVWRVSRVLTEKRTKKDRPKLGLGGVSLNDTREPWRYGDTEQTKLDQAEERTRQEPYNIEAWVEYARMLRAVLDYVDRHPVQRPSKGVEQL